MNAYRNIFRRWVSDGQMQGHDYDIRHFKTLRTCPDLHVEREPHLGDRLNLVLAVVLLVMLGAGWL